MVNDIKFEELSKEEKLLLLRAFDYDLDNEGFILSPSGSRIQSQELPSKFLSLVDVALTPGSLNVIEATPTSISKFIREKIEKSNEQ